MVINLKGDLPDADFDEVEEKLNELLEKWQDEVNAWLKIHAPTLKAEYV